MKIIRGQLNPGDVSNPAFRYSVDCDCVQYSPDGGTTWNDATGSDPRHASAFRLSARTGSDRNCNAAANMVAWIKGVVNDCIHICEVGGVVVALVNKILDFADVIFAEEGGVLLALIQNIAGVVFDAGFAALSAAFTSDQYDLMLCIFYCHDGADGQVTPEQFALIQANITAQLNTVAATITNLFLSLQGEVGLSNAGAQGTETADCSGCDCGWCRSSDYVTTEDLAEMTNEGGAWSMGDGYVGTEYIGFTSFSQQYPSPLTPVVVTHLEMTYSATGFGLGGNVSLQLYLAGVQEQIVVSTTAGSHQTIIWDGSQSIDEFYLTCATHDVDGVVKLESWLLRGFGVAPEVGQIDCG